MMNTTRGLAAPPSPCGTVRVRFADTINQTCVCVCRCVAEHMPKHISRRSIWIKARVEGRWTRSAANIIERERPEKKLKNETAMKLPNHSSAGICAGLCAGTMNVQFTVHDSIIALERFVLSTHMLRQVRGKVLCLRSIRYKLIENIEFT